MRSSAPASARSCNSKSLAKFPDEGIFSENSRNRPGFHRILHWRNDLPTKYGVCEWLFSAILTRRRGYAALRLYGETIGPGVGVAKRMCRIAVSPHSCPAVSSPRCGSGPCRFLCPGTLRGRRRGGGGSSSDRSFPGAGGGEDKRQRRWRQ